MTGLVEFDQADASVSLWMRNQYECALSYKDQNVQHAVPASMFSPFDELERWFEGAYPTLRQRRILGRG
jgi:hypothetical protein